MNNTCLVVLTDSLYLPGTLALLASWDRHNPALPAVALSAEREALGHPSIVGRCSQRILIDASEYQSIRFYKKRRSKMHSKTFCKFEAFRDFGYQRNLFLDSDLLCLKPCPALLSQSPESLQAALDTGFRKTRAYKGHPSEINSGVLGIGKALQGEKTIAALKEIARHNPGRGGYNSGDQGILNKWIHRNTISLQLLPAEYNTIKKNYADASNISDCRLLHFAGRKPWISPSAEPLATLWSKHRDIPSNANRYESGDPTSASTRALKSSSST